MLNTTVTLLVFFVLIVVYYYIIKSRVDKVKEKRIYLKINSILDTHAKIISVQYFELKEFIKNNESIFFTEDNLKKYKNEKAILDAEIKNFYKTINENIVDFYKNCFKSKEQILLERESYIEKSKSEHEKQPGFHFDPIGLYDFMYEPPLSGVIESSFNEIEERFFRIGLKISRLKITLLEDDFSHRYFGFMDEESKKNQIISLKVDSIYSAVTSFFNKIENMQEYKDEIPYDKYRFMIERISIFLKIISRPELSLDLENGLTRVFPKI